MFGPKGLKFSVFDRGYPGVVIRKSGEYQRKILLVGLFFPSKFPGCGHNSMPK